MEKIAIIYGSTTGNTTSVAKTIKSKLGDDAADLFEVSRFDPANYANYKNLILATSTMGFGDLQDEWEDAVSDLSDADLSGKVIALVGLGDGEGYPDTFVDGMGALYAAIKDKGCTVVGQTPTEGYEYDDSTAVVDGQFVGLALDEDNSPDETEGRIDAWLEKVTRNFL